MNKETWKNTFQLLVNRAFEAASENRELSKRLSVSIYVTLHMIWHAFFSSHSTSYSHQWFRKDLQVVARKYRFWSRVCCGESSAWTYLWTHGSEEDNEEVEVSADCHTQHQPSVEHVLQAESERHVVEKDQAVTAIRVSRRSDSARCARLRRQNSTQMVRRSGSRAAGARTSDWKRSWKLC